MKWNTLKIGFAFAVLFALIGVFSFAEGSSNIESEHSHEVNVVEDLHMEKYDVMLAEQRTCPVCKGDGKCSECRGSGRCDDCNGSGYRDRQHKHKCRSCSPSGSGKCSHCHGRGKCQNCSGRGTYTSRG